MSDLRIGQRVTIAIQHREQFNAEVYDLLNGQGGSVVEINHACNVASSPYLVQLDQPTARQSWGGSSISHFHFEAADLAGA